MLLGDEVQERAVKITYRGTEVTAKIVNELINKYLQALERQVHGKQSLRQLNRKGKALDSIPVASADLKGLQNELRKFGVDYSVRKNTAEKNTFEIYFKGTDIGQIQASLKTYAEKSLKRQERPPMKERMEAAVQKARAVNQNLKEKKKQKQRGREER